MGEVARWGPVALLICKRVTIRRKGAPFRTVVVLFPRSLRRAGLDRVENSSDLPPSLHEVEVSLKAQE